MLSRNEDKIAEGRVEFLKKPEARRFYNLSDRLVEWEDLYDKFMGPDNFLGFEKLGKDSTQAVYGPKAESARECLRCASADVNTTRRTDLEIKRETGGSDDEDDDKPNRGSGRSDRGFSWKAG